MTTTGATDPLDAPLGDEPYTKRYPTVRVVVELSADRQLSPAAVADLFLEWLQAAEEDLPKGLASIDFCEELAE